MEEVVVSLISLVISGNGEAEEVEAEMMDQMVMTIMKMKMVAEWLLMRSMVLKAWLPKSAS